MVKNNYKSVFNERKINLSLTIVTFLLVIVTIILIFVTIKLTNATNDIKNVEIYLGLERQKEEVSENINLALNLIIEISNNEAISMGLINNLGILKNTSEISADYLEIVRTEQARDKSTFGTPEIREYLGIYLENLNQIKISIDELAKAQGINDMQRKTEHINRAISFAHNIIDNNSSMESDNLISKIKSYINDETVYLNKLNEKQQKSSLTL